MLFLFKTKNILRKWGGGGRNNQKKRRQIKKLIARLTREVKEHLQDENTSVINKFVWKLKMLL